jgi:hypothetical protein
MKVMTTALPLGTVVLGHGLHTGSTPAARQ